MGSELTQLRRDAADARKLQTALAAAERARAEVEERLRAALRENAGAARGGRAGATAFDRSDGVGAVGGARV